MVQKVDPVREIGPLLFICVECIADPTREKPTDPQTVAPLRKSVTASERIHRTFELAQVVRNLAEHGTQLPTEVVVINEDGTVVVTLVNGFQIYLLPDNSMYGHPGTDTSGRRRQISQEQLKVVVSTLRDVIRNSLKKG